MSDYRVEASRLVAGVGHEEAFDRLMATPLPSIFFRRHALIPAVREVRDQDGEWGTVGQTRTIVLADGGTLHETLTSVERPDSFGYVLDGITGRMRPFVKTVDGTWSVTPEGDGVRVGWAWVLNPLAPPAFLTMNVIGRMWHGYADLALHRVEAILTS